MHTSYYWFTINKCHSPRPHPHPRMPSWDWWSGFQPKTFSKRVNRIYHARQEKPVLTCFQHILKFRSSQAHMVSKPFTAGVHDQSAQMKSDVPLNIWFMGCTPLCLHSTIAFFLEYLSHFTLTSTCSCFKLHLSFIFSEVFSFLFYFPFYGE